MDIHQAGSRPAKPGPKEYFSGTVSVEPIIATANAPSRVLAASVAFEPGARTAWHTHPLGQTLYVVSGVGLVRPRAGQSAKSTPATKYGSHREKNTGTAPRRPPP